MGGMGSVFKKLIPFIMLICFITFGLTVIFGNVTYLSSKNINGTTVYNFDFVKYVKNINFNHIKSAVNNTIDIATLNKVLDSFRELWKDGYIFGNLIKTVIGGIILILDVIISIISVLLIVPLRIIGGLILTILNIIGIDTTKTFWLTDLNKGLLNLKPIPLIPWKGGESTVVTTVPSLT